MPLTQVSSRLIEDTLRYVLGASGTNHYTFTGKGLTGAVNDPTLTLSRGHTYIFENRNSSGAHPFYIKTSIANGGTNDAYNTGVTNNGGAGGTEIVFTVPHDAPDLLYYQCSSHINMAGQLKIAGAVADGSITTAKLEDSTGTTDGVTTAKIADDAVTADKLANSINTEIAANTAKTSNATHTGEVTGATALTIADDVVDEANLKVSNTPTNGYFLSAQSGNTGGLTWAAAGGLDGVTTGSGNVTITNGNLIIGTSGKGIDFSATSNASTTGASMSNELFDDYEEGTWTPVLARSSGTTQSTYVNRNATYTKIGRVVHAVVNFYTTSGIGGSGNYHLNGLPFAPDTSNTGSILSSCSFRFSRLYLGNGDFAGGENENTFELVSGKSYARLRNIDNNSLITSLSGNTFIVNGQITYFAAT